MKKFTWLLLSLIFVNRFFSIAQITHENSFDCEFAYVVQIKDNVIKYCAFLPSQNQIKLYNLDGTLYRTLNNYPDSMDIYYVTEELFNLDSKIEYLAYHWDYGVSIFNEDGDIIYAADSLELIEDLNESWFEIQSINNTENGAKMALINWDTKKLEVFSLPGKLPIGNAVTTPTLLFENDTLSVSGGNSVYLGGYANTDNQQLSISNDTIYLTNGGWIFVGDTEVSNIEAQVFSSNNTVTNIYPNPSSSDAYINYHLPESETEGTLKLYNSEGKTVTTFYLDGTRNVEKLELDFLNSGIYFYQVETKSGSSRPGKLVIKR